MKNIRFLMNAFSFERFVVYEMTNKKADEFLNMGIAVEVETKIDPTIAEIREANKAENKKNDSEEEVN